MSEPLVRVISYRDLQPWRQREAVRFASGSVRIDPDKIGWLPWDFYDYHAARGNIVLVYNNDDLVGHTVYAIRERQLKLYQCWVRPDARLILHGKALAEELDNIGRARTCWQVRLWCAQDLAANYFWEAIGFRNRGWRRGNGRKSRRANLWTRTITQQATQLVPELIIPA